MTTQKFVLVRPRGGLNDNFTQIEHCWLYAEQYGRTLLVDTAQSEGFHQPFSTIFQVARSACKVSCASAVDLDALFSGGTVLPHALQGLKASYPVEYDKSIRNFIHSGSRAGITFDFTTGHPEELVVHQRCGGQPIAIAGLSRLRFTDEYRARIIERLAPVAGKRYLAIHVRHTDYRTDYKAFFDAAQEMILSYEHCLLCTDSIEVYQYARQRFGDGRVFQLWSVPDTGGISLHQYTGTLDEASRKEALVNQFADLLGLAMGTQLVGGKLVSGGLEGYSGFLVLANGLQSNPWIIGQLLGWRSDDLLPRSRAESEQIPLSRP